MAPVDVSGTQGYAEEAGELIKQYESIPFADAHRRVLHLLPRTPGNVLDIGAGTGRDAAHLAAIGHRVVAVEPTAQLRRAAVTLHPSPRIDWVDDSLPELASLADRKECFDLVMLTAVWMHLDVEQRRRGMPNVAALVKPGAVLILTLRHGPVPPGRRMFEVSAEETIGLAEAAGLSLILNLERQPGSFGRPEVSWSRIAFSKHDGR